jgi:hypothetical protein
VIFYCFEFILFLYFYRNDIEIPDEETEEEIIRRQRLRREQLKKVNLISFLFKKKFFSLEIN